MSVVGIDFGNDNSLIAITRRGGVDVVLNESSQRQTPNVVSFTEQRRLVGESGAGQAILNWKNTVTQVKRLLCVKFADAQEELPFLGYQVKADANGYCLIEVNYLGKKIDLTPQQVVAMLLAKLKENAEHEIGNKVTDCVITVPPYFTDMQRRAMLNAAEVAGLHCLKLVNDTTAAAIDYGFYKTDLSDTQPLNVAFVDIGQADTSVAIVSFTKSQLKVLSTASDNTLGARNFDYVLANYFAEQIKNKYKVDVNTNMKAKLRVLQTSEKLKKVLSANAVSVFGIENLMDVDVSFPMERAKLEELSQPLVERFEAPIRKAIELSGLSLDQIHFVEVLGGGCRIPAVKAKISSVFGKPLFTTVNAAEAVVKGAAIQAAMLSPSFRVRDFGVLDSLPNAINLGWKSNEDVSAPETALGINKQTPVFKVGDGFPSTKMLTFNRAEDFEVVALYAHPEEISAHVDPIIARVSITVPPTKNGQPAKIKVKVKENIHAILQVEGAQLVEEVEDEAAAAKSADAMETESADKDAKMEEAKPAEEPKKKKVKRVDLAVKAVYNEFTREQITTAIKLESEMQKQERLIIETAEKKNALESYIYDARDKIGDYGDHNEFVSEADRAVFLEALNNAQNWLYEDGDDAEKAAYETKLAELKAIGDPVAKRAVEANKRPQAVQGLRDALSKYVTLATSTEEKYAHIDQAERERVLGKCTEVNTWLESEIRKADAAPKHQDSSLTAAAIGSKQRELENFNNVIMNKPKPKPQPAPAPAPAAQPAADAQPEQQQPQPEQAAEQAEKPKAKVDDLD